MRPTRHGHRRIRTRAAVAALVAVLAALLSAGAASAASHRSSPVSTARGLATQVTRAHTTRARRTALLKTLRALGIGVYSSRGKTIQRAHSRLWLYDFELTGITDALRRKRLVTADQLAANLAGMGVNRSDGSPLSGAALATAVPAAARVAAHAPRSRKSLASLVIAQLARRDHRPLSGAGARFDALQAWLIEADVASAARVRPAHPRVHASSLTEPCFTGQRRVSQGLKGFGAISDILQKVGETAVSAVADPLHMAALSYLIDFQPTSGGQVTTTHWGPAGHDASRYVPGDKLQFQVGVQMLGKVPEKLVRCGPLAGLRFPDPGPIPGVPIHWDNLLPGYQTLERNGTIFREDGETDSTGRATLIFYPRDEFLPGVGQELDVSQTLEPSADILSVFGNTLGNLYEALGLRFTGFGFHIARHAPRGFKFDVLADYSHVDGTGRTVQSYHRWEGHVCGEDPYLVQWTGRETTYDQNYADDPGNNPSTTDVIWIFNPGVDSTYDYGSPIYPSPNYEYTMRLDEANQRIAITSNAYGNDETRTVYGPISEDTSCPEPTP